MVVQHNLTAMNSNRMLGVTTGSQAKSTEKLSSGYKINRAADDAAGLSISEKMRKQIRGLTQASLNAEDGISAVQTAEGALTEVHDMLQRMNELAVKAANGTMSEDDRSYVQNEIDQLVTEIDRVSSTTKFNETYLLKGDSELKVGSADQTANIAGQTAKLGADANVNVGDYALGTVTIAKSAAETAASNATSGAIASATIDDSNAALINLMNQTTTNGALSFEVGVAATTGTDAEKFANTTWKIHSEAGGGTVLDGVTTAELASKYGINLTQNGTTALAAGDEFVIEKDLVRSSTQSMDLSKANITFDETSVAAANINDYKVGQNVLATVYEDSANPGKALISGYNSGALPSDLKLSLHVGADSTNNNKIEVDIAAMSAKGLGLLTNTGEALRVDGKDSTNADKAIDTIAAAIQKVSTQRSALGAVQNRLEHTIANLDNVVENTTAAESQIRDTDMATEMVKYSNNNILAQAGTSMLAQANQSNQNILSLLG